MLLITTEVLYDNAFLFGASNEKLWTWLFGHKRPAIHAGLVLGVCVAIGVFYYHEPGPVMQAAVASAVSAVFVMTFGSLLLALLSGLGARACSVFYYHGDYQRNRLSFNELQAEAQYHREEGLVERPYTYLNAYRWILVAIATPLRVPEFAWRFWRWLVWENGQRSF